MRNLVKHLAFKPHTCVNMISFLLRGVSFGPSIQTLGFIHIYNRGSISIGSHVRIISGWQYNPIGCGDRTALCTHEGGKIVIGSGTGISNTTIVSAVGITIGQYVRIGSGVRIYDTDFHSLNPYVRTSRPENQDRVKKAPVILDDYSFIGSGALILKGVTVGRSSVIGANSVVSTSVPPDEVWCGNPAKKIRDLTESEKTMPIESQPIIAET